MRQQILADADRRYREYAEELEGKRMAKTKRAEKLRDRYDEIQRTIDQRKMGTRIWKLSNTCVYGTDANELYPNERMLPGMRPEDTCLEVYRRFCKNPAEFVLEAQS